MNIFLSYVSNDTRYVVKILWYIIIDRIEEAKAIRKVANAIVTGRLSRMFLVVLTIAMLRQARNQTRSKVNWYIKAWRDGRGFSKRSLSG